MPKKKYSKNKNKKGTKNTKFQKKAKKKELQWNGQGIKKDNGRSEFN